MNDWVDLEMRLLKNKTIDKNVQEQINRPSTKVEDEALSLINNCILVILCMQFDI